MAHLSSSEITEGKDKVGSPRSPRSMDDRVFRMSGNSRRSNPPGYLYGFVFNRQRQDERLKRGGEQKSVVILSYCPYSSVFRRLLQILGPLCLMTKHKEALWNTYSTTTKPDTAILNRLIDAAMSPRVEESMSIVNVEILRRHFL